MKLFSVLMLDGSRFYVKGRNILKVAAVYPGYKAIREVPRINNHKKRGIKET